MPTTRTTTWLYALGLFVLGALVALAAEHLVFHWPDQRDAMKTIGGFPDYNHAIWGIECDPRTLKKGGCIVQQRLVQRGTNNAVAELTVIQSDKGDVFRIIAPLGVLVAPGVKLKIGDATPRPVPFKTCLQLGCIATLPLDTTLADALLHSRGGQIVLIAANGKSVPIAFSLNGYADAMAARAVDNSARKW